MALLGDVTLEPSPRDNVHVRGVDSNRDTSLMEAQKLEGAPSCSKELSGMRKYRIEVRLRATGRVSSSTCHSVIQDV